MMLIPWLCEACFVINMDTTVGGGGSPGHMAVAFMCPTTSQQPFPIDSWALSNGRDINIDCP